jgi:hypothetical protein
MRIITNKLYEPGGTAWDSDATCYDDFQGEICNTYTDLGKQNIRAQRDAGGTALFLSYK